MKEVAGHRVERTEGFVHEETRRPAGRARVQAPPADASRPDSSWGRFFAKSPRLTRAEELRRPTAARSARGTFRSFKREVDVPACTQPREERGLLEHQRRVSRTHVDGSTAGPVESGHEIQQCALPTAGRAEQAHELALWPLRATRRRAHGSHHRRCRRPSTRDRERSHAENRPRRGGAEVDSVRSDGCRRRHVFAAGMSRLPAAVKALLRNERS